MPRFSRPQFSLKSIMLLSLGFALGYAWNLWVWRYQGLPGTEAKMVRLPTYVIEPPDILNIDVTAGSSKTAEPAVTGQHLVAMDGRVNLGKYGSVFVAGLTMDEAAAAIKKQLAVKVDRPQVVIDVLAYNSKVYYVIQQTGTFGNVTRLPITGNETALDAIAKISGLSITGAIELWIARPAPNSVGSQQNIPVDYAAITQGAAASNPQILPGDRLFISQKNPPNPTPAVLNLPAIDTAVQPATATAPSTPYRLPDDVQYYEPSSPEAPGPDSLPNKYLYVKPQLDQQRNSARPIDEQPSATRP